MQLGLLRQSDFMFMTRHTVSYSSFLLCVDTQCTSRLVGHIEKRDEKYDRLVVAISDLKLREDMTGQPSSDLQMKAGDIKWLNRE